MTQNNSKDIKSGSMQTTIHFMFHGKIKSRLQKFHVQCRLNEGEQ